MRTNLLLLVCLLVPVGTVGGADLRVERRDGMLVLLEGAELVGTFGPAAAATVRWVDDIRCIQPHVIRWRREFSLRPGEERQRVRLTLDFLAAHRSGYSLVPGISYDGNTRDGGNVYRGFDCEGEPWSFAWHRTPVPGATYSEGARHSVALFGTVTDPGVGLACSLIPGEATTLHRLIFPEEEQPRRILGRKSGLSPGRASRLELGAGEIFVATAYLVVTPVTRPRTGYRHFLDFAWRLGYREPRAHRTVGELWCMGIRFARESLWAPDAGMFSLALLNDGTGWRRAGGFQIGWCGRNGSLANCLLVDHLSHGGSSSPDPGIACLDAWAARAPAAGGLLAAGSELADFREIADDANNLGAAATEFLRAARLAPLCGVDGDHYAAVALGICDAAAAVQTAGGGFADWSAAKDGIGANLIPALIAAYRFTGAVDYLESALAANGHYMSAFLAEGRLGGSSLDTLSTDLESAFPLLEGNVALFEITGKEQYLDWAEDVAYYCASWQIVHSVPPPPGSLMDAIAYDTYGAHTVATVHMCCHCFTLAIVPHLIRLAEHTGRDIWRERALAIWANGTTGISDGTYELMDRGPRPVGSQDETYFHTDWSIEWGSSGNLDMENPRGAASQWLTAWPTAMRLDILADDALRDVLARIPVQRVAVR